jgi:hypothetical protein
MMPNLFPPLRHDLIKTDNEGKKNAPKGISMLLIMMLAKAMVMATVMVMVMTNLEVTKRKQLLGKKTMVMAQIIMIMINIHQIKKKMPMPTTHTMRVAACPL